MVLLPKDTRGAPCPCRGLDLGCVEEEGEEEEDDENDDDDVSMLLMHNGQRALL